MLELSLSLHREDPGQPVDKRQIQRTLAALRADPLRGRAVVAEVEREVVAFALLISFWSNEYGGEICAIDELYVVAGHRGAGIGSRLFEAVIKDRKLWPRRPVALELEVTPDNARARALYERLGFRARNQTLRRRVARKGQAK